MIQFFEHQAARISLAWRHGVLPVLASAVLLACRPPQAEPTEPVKPSTSGPTWLRDVTASVRLHFTNDSGATGRYIMWEQMASGGALFDFNGDDRLDVYLVHCGGPSSTSRNQLFQQQPDGTFRDVSQGSGLDVTGLGMGAIVGDVNNDGRPDLVLTEYGATRLFLNLGTGQFTEVSREAAIDNPRWATAASFLDYDRDGWLDLVVVNYLDYDPARDCRDHLGAPEYCGPQDFPGTVTRLFRNLGPQPESRPRFADVSVDSGIARTLGPGLGVLCADFDGDRWPDIFVTDDGKPNRLLINRRNGTFVNEAPARGIAYNAMGATAGNMGVAPGDLNGDGLFDLVVTHLTHEQHAVWMQGPRGLFQDRVVDVGLLQPQWRGTGFGAVLADLDLDGALDLAIVNGRVLRGAAPGPRLEGLHPLWHPYAERYQLFRNDGHGRLQEISLANPDFSGRAAVGRGLAMGDLDNDGDLDLVSTSTGGPAQVFRNEAPRQGHWLTVRPVFPALGGRDAIGAEITVVAGHRRFWRLAQPSSSFLVSHDPRVHFGLGPATSVDALHVVWPDGVEEVFPGGPADQHLVVRRGEGRKVPSPAAPPSIAPAAASSRPSP